MGFVIDDPTRPQDVSEAAKKFFNEGSNINCCGDWTPKCCPLISINNHVLDWLSKPERERYYLIEVTFSFSYQYERNKLEIRLSERRFGSRKPGV